MMHTMKLIRPLLTISLSCIFALLTLSACTTNFTSNDTVDYKSKGAVRGPNLSVPPDLITAQADRRYTVQDGTATMSEYSSALKKTVKTRKDVLSGIPGMRIERDGERRWLVIDKPATELYPQVKDFWQENGFLLTIDSPSTGIMETDWAENRAKLPQDFIRSVIGKALDSVYDTGERDKYKTRLEVVNSGATEIFITQIGSLEVCVTDTSGTCNSTIWTSRPNDPELEATFLARLMERLGMTQEQAKAQVAIPLKAKTPKAKLIEEGSNAAYIAMTGNFDRAWRDTGLALDRSNFTVEDRDRSKGIYFVRYVNSKTTEEKKGFFSGLFSSKDETKLQAKKYRVLVKTSGENSANIYVQDIDGNPENTPSGIQFLTLLTQQLSR